jgi:hypothetical protein
VLIEPSELVLGSALVTVEPMTGIEPAYSAWEVISVDERALGRCVAVGRAHGLRALVAALEQSSRLRSS